MKFLSVVTPPYIYYGCSTRKTFWEEKFTGKKDLFQSVNMKHFGRRKVRKHKEIKGSDKIFTLNVSAKFESPNKMETTSSESKGKLGRSGKGLVTALAFKTKVRFRKNKKGKVCHRKCQREGTFEDYQRVWENWQGASSFFFFLLVRPPRPQSLLIMGWWSSIPEHRLWIPLDSGPIV